MISKELLSEVLVVELEKTQNILNPIPVGKEKGSDVLFYWIKGQTLFHGCESINIHELAYKCKEWAWNNGGYVIDIHYTWLGFGTVVISITKNRIPVHIILEEKSGFEFPLEPKYVFQACQWILENKDK